MSTLSDIVAQVSNIASELQTTRKQSEEYCKYLVEAAAFIYDAVGENKSMKDCLSALSSALKSLKTMNKQLDEAIKLAKDWIEEHGGDWNPPNNKGTKAMTNNDGGRSK